MPDEFREDSHLEEQYEDINGGILNQADEFWDDNERDGYHNPLEEEEAQEDDDNAFWERIEDSCG